MSWAGLRIAMSLLHLALTAAAWGGFFLFAMGGHGVGPTLVIFDALTFPIGWIGRSSGAAAEVVAAIANSFLWGYGIAGPIELMFRTRNESD
jgi:hypothetical protein